MVKTGAIRDRSSRAMGSRGRGSGLARLMVSLLCLGGAACQTGRRPADSLMGRPVASRSDEGLPARVTIVVDIDDTLSATDYASLFLGTGKDRSRPRDRAREVLTKLAERFDLLYLTARPQSLFVESRTWLAKHGFPPGPVLTTSRVTDLFWPGTFKARVLAALRARSPDILIGIGDRQSDAEAYACNHMLPLIVHPRRGRDYPAQTMRFEDWQQLGEYLRAQAGRFADAATVRREFAVGQASPHPRDLPARESVLFMLPIKAVLYGPLAAGEAIAKLELIQEQAEARRALAISRLTLDEALKLAENQLAGAQILKVQLRVQERRAMYVAWFVEEGTIRKLLIDAQTGAALGTQGSLRTMHDERAAARLARLTFRAAMARARREIAGDCFEIELEIDDMGATYEVAMHALERFYEIEIQAETGEIVEVEDETTVRGP